MNETTAAEGAPDRRPTPQRWTLRLNLLEQCQLECGYCRPGSLKPATRRSEWLNAEEYARLGRLLAARGVDKVRLTGGEPLLREDAVEVLGALHESMPQCDLALTTNGQRLGHRLDALANAGLSRVTVHVDSLRPQRYRELMGGEDSTAPLRAVVNARDRLREAKLNVVVQRGRNDDELWDFLEWGRSQHVEVRFIELMNTGSAVDYVRSVFISGHDIIARIGAREAVTPLPRRRAADPAALFRTASGIVFGLIASDTQPFCDHCNRLRLLPDGTLRGCLYQPNGVPLGASLRAGATDRVLGWMLDTALREKRSFHPALPMLRTPFSMSEAGG